MLRAVLVAVITCSLFGAGSANAQFDTDGDGVADFLDNCLLIPNAPPLDCDSDLDGYGNVCDGLDGAAGTCEVPPWLDAFVAGGPGFADHDCNGVVNSHDLEGFFLSLVAGTCQGPSGLACAGIIPCQ